VHIQNKLSDCGCYLLLKSGLRHHHDSQVYKETDDAERPQVYMYEYTHREDHMTLVCSMPELQPSRDGAVTISVESLISVLSVGSIMYY
jgi:hypothetical protein